ncbi:MAG: hypothetical protein GXY01_04015 [Clostridiales bacterium]|jgi:hypothetical protein|nr:hypothetical protein [Clostridiales bacterium]
MSVIFFKPRDSENGYKEASVDIKKYTSKKLKTIGLYTILDIIKHGEEIGLTVENNDSDDNMYRILELENVRIELIEWRVLSIWTIKIEIFNDDKSLIVYRSPYLDINWHSKIIEWAEISERWKPLEVQWDEKGEWCYYISESISKLAEKLEKKRRTDKLKKEEEENMQNHENERLRLYFNSLFKSERSQHKT